MEAVLFDKYLNKIKQTLEAASKTDYYSEVFERAGINPAKVNSYSTFAKIPILTKSLYRQHLYRLLAPPLQALIDRDVYEGLGTDYNARKTYLIKRGLYVRITSGSTGEPLEVIKSKRDIKRDYLSLHYYRSRLLGSPLAGEFVWIWPVNSYTRRHFYNDKDSLFYTVNKHGYQYMIAELSDTSFEGMFDFMIGRKIRWITASPSMLAYFARYLLNHGLELPDIMYIECHSEGIVPWQRDLIHQAFGLDPVSIYSSNEIQFMAMTCRQGNCHVLANNVFIELIDDGLGVKEVVATTLNNFDVPLLRYKLGDCAVWAVDQKCDCPLGKYPIVSLHGFRTNDLLLSSNGTRYEAFIVADSVFLASRKLGIEIGEYRVRQQSYDHFIYYMDGGIIDDRSKVEQLRVFLASYLREVLKYECTVDIHTLASMTRNIYAGKYKYFEVARHLQSIS